MKYLIVIFALILVGCSPQKRLNNLLVKYPELTKTKTDTITTTKTLYEVDTFKILQSSIDTVLIASDCDNLISQLDSLVVENSSVKTVFSIDTLYLKNSPAKQLQLNIKTTQKERTVTQADSVKTDVQTVINNTICEPLIIYKVPKYMKIVVWILGGLVVALGLFSILLGRIAKR
jgi:hypothetical protein